ncbi:cysteine rich repeat-containing protein [Pseudorhodoplanes sp.]|uniref:cysteine rich repeat-containing protein n=1 Tax=Pseudorhodoplanes sp. TaxID=1934341 RepID=UPI002C3E8515|nr:cysteine rich repeat-containing protein [Pseudorhodoplanes sp.]HWV40369.1 cysteine rich repeat-containing protein [Pseudorhodoplanes sp.]
MFASKAAVFLTILTLGGTGMALAQQQPGPVPLPFPNMMQGTPEEERACAPDSAKFCQRFEPDPLQVLGCLQRNRAQISKACQAVLRNRGV